MFHKVKDVQVIPDYKLNVYFTEGQHKIYDLHQLGEKVPEFDRLLNDEELMNSVKVDIGGYGIVWDDYFDLSCDELWEHGEKISSPL